MASRSDLERTKPYYVEQSTSTWASNPEPGCSPWDDLPLVGQIEAVVILVIVIFAILILLVSEYQAHDCIPGKKCNHRVPSPTADDDNLTYVDKISAMISNNYNYVSWRLALLAGLIATLPVIYFLRGRIPTLIEWLVVGGLIFLGTYLSFSWIGAHFFYPNGVAIENRLTDLRDRIQQLEASIKH